MPNFIVNFLRWFDIKVLHNGAAYRRFLLKNGFFDADGWSDDEVLDYLHR